MATYNINNNEVIEIDFNGIIPSLEIRNKMKSAKYRWDPVRRIWYAHKNDYTLRVAIQICGKKQFVSDKDYALKIKIKQIVNADSAQIESWKKQLNEHVNGVMLEEDSNRDKDAVNNSQIYSWIDCFNFIQKTLSKLSLKDQEYSLFFEYSLPGTVHERPDVILLTNKKVILLEFKRKTTPQIDKYKDDIAQVYRYQEWIQNHHKVTKDKQLKVKSYLVCTVDNAASGELRGIEILNEKNFCDVVAEELKEENLCSFEEEWCKSLKTEMPDMLQAIEIMYREKRIPYISEVNEQCLNKVVRNIDYVKNHKIKLLILINGVPGAGKTAIGQSIVYEKNRDGKADAVYLSGNGPLVEVLQYQINKVGGHKNMGENVIQGMKEFKATYFHRDAKVPEQSILIFDEAQRAWDDEKLGTGYSEPEGLFRVGERIFNERQYVVLIGLYGNGQVIYKGEEEGLSLWKKALEDHTDWFVVTSQSLASGLQGLGRRQIVDNDLFLSASLRADFIDCSRWVEQAIGRTNTSLLQAKQELEKIQNTSLRIFVTRDFASVKQRVEEIKRLHNEWKCGILISNFAEQEVVEKGIEGWEIGYNKKNVVSLHNYGQWFTGGCNNLEQACSVYGNQGLELDCPIVLFGGEYVRENGCWKPRGSRFFRDKKAYKDPASIVENNFRVLLTRARKEMILFIPKHTCLDETYQYFVNMGLDIL